MPHISLNNFFTLKVAYMASFEFEQYHPCFWPQLHATKGVIQQIQIKKDFALAAKNYSSKYGGSKNTLSFVTAMGP